MTDYYESIFQTESIAAFLVQLYVFYLLFFECAPEMKEYAYYLRLLAGYDFMFNLSFGIITAPRSLYPAYGDTFNGPAKYFRIEFRVFCVALSGYFGSMIVFVQLYCLLYRYLLVQIHKNLYYYLVSTRCKIGTQIIFQVVAIALGAYNFSVLCLDENCTSKVIKDWEERSSLTRLDYGVMGREYPHAMSRVITVIMCFFEITSFVLLYLTLKQLGKNVGSMAPDTYRLYRQFTILLGAQLLTPLIFIFTPVILFTLFAYFDITTKSAYIHAGNVGLVSYGLVNSLLTVLFITPFRRHAAKTFVYWWLGPLLRLLKCSKCLQWLKLDDVIPSVPGCTVTKITQVTPVHNHNI